MFPLIGTILLFIALVAFSRVTADTKTWVVMIPMLVFGFGLGNCMQPLVLALQNAVSPRDIGVATASATFFRQIGGTLGVAIFLSILFSTVGDKVQTAFTDAQSSAAFRSALADPANGETLKGLQGGFTNDSSGLDRLPAVLAHPFKVGFSQSMSVVFLCAAAVVLIGIVVVLFLPQVEPAWRVRPAGRLRRPGRRREVGAGRS
nr:hypothetical protein [Angustibacter aerolatus]